MAERASASPSTSRPAIRRRWKRAEREVAAHLGGVRVPVNGRGFAPDVDHPLLSLEIKQTSSPPQRIEKAVCQAERASEWCRRKQGVEKLPVAVIHQAGRPMGKSLVVMRLEDFEAWFRSGGEARRAE